MSTDHSEEEIAALAARVEELEQQLDQQNSGGGMSMSRRGVLGSLAGAGVARAALGSLSEPASAQTAVGQLGSSSERLDVFGATVDTTALEADQVTSTAGDRTTWSESTTIITVDASGAGDFSTIQDAVDSVPRFIDHPITIDIIAGDYSSEDVIVPPVVGSAAQPNNEYVPLKIEGDSTTPSNVPVGSVLFEGGLGAVCVQLEGVEIQRGNPHTNEDAGVEFYGCWSSEINSCNFVGTQDVGIMSYASHVMLWQIDFGSGPIDKGIRNKHGGTFTVNGVAGDYGVQGTVNHLFHLGGVMGVVGSDTASGTGSDPTSGVTTNDAKTNAYGGLLVDSGSRTIEGVNSFADSPHVEADSAGLRSESGTVTVDHAPAADSTTDSWDQISKTITFDTAFSAPPEVFCELQDQGPWILTNPNNISPTDFDVTSRNYTTTDLGSATIQWRAVGPS